jgi:hypothetical protein
MRVEAALFVITSPAPPGMVIQLDAHVAPLLGMTFVRLIGFFWLWK